MKTSPQQSQLWVMAMDWYVPDGTNHRIIEVPDKSIADFRSPGGGTGALILTLSRMILHYNTARYMVDIDTGELFGWIANQWRCTGLYCSTQPFVIKELIAMTNRCSAALQMDLEQEQQTSVVQAVKQGEYSESATSTCNTRSRSLRATAGCNEPKYAKKLHQRPNKCSFNVYYRI